MFYNIDKMEEGHTNEGSNAVKWMDLLLNTSSIFNNLDINYQDRLGATVLHYLAMIPGPDSLKIFENLIQNGADFTIEDKEKNNVIHYSIKYNNVNITKFLLNNYKDKILEVKDLNGYNLLTYCIQKYSWECLSEVVDLMGSQILEIEDENAEATPSKFAKKIGFEEFYK